MSIRKKIIRTLKLSTFLTLLTGIACFGMIKLIDYMYAETINSGVPQLEQQQLIEKYIIEEAKFVQLYLLGNPESLQEYHSVQDQLKVAVEQLDLLFDETTSKEQLYSLKEQITTYEAQLNEVIQLYEGNRYKRALDLLKNEVIITQHDIEEASAAFTNETKSNFNELMEHVGNITLYSIIGLIIILSISLVIGRTTANKLNKEVISPLEQLNTAFNHLQKGELNYTLPPMQLQNEIGNLADSFRSMQNQLTQLIQATKHNAKNLNHISSDFVQITNEVNKTSAIISTNTQDAAETIINISNASKESREAIDQSANALKNIAASTENMLNQMITTTKQATAGSHHIQQANQHMQEIHQSTNTTNSLIQTLAKQSKEIESFSKVITKITEQTNLLALNASIEAARAGEHGLGFAVVANEVRNLADESKKASDKIVQLTNEIQRGMNNVEQAILLNLNNVETGVEALQVADQTFTAIATEIFDVEQQTKLIFNETDLISVTSTQLASAMLQITEQIDEISAQMQEISAATMLQASSIATVTNSSTQLATNASTLELQLQHFKLNSDQ